MTASAPAELLSAAQAGDEHAFGALLQPHRNELQAHCYRLLGSLHDAEDALQDTLLRAWRGLRGFDGRSSLRSWLYRIATNASLDIGRRRSKVVVLPTDHGPPVTGGWDQSFTPAESVRWLQPLPDYDSGPEATYERRESVELAFVAALQHLPANQRACVVLCDVLRFSAQEAAETLGTSETAVRSALQRARAALGDRLPDQSQQATLRALGDAATKGVVERYTDALARGDVESIVALLAKDATWSMPPYAQWFSGLDAIIEFLRTGPAPLRWRHIPTRANGQLAAGCYLWDPDRRVFAAEVVDVLTVDDEGRITAITAFIDSRLFPAFGLPDHLDP